MTRVYEQVAVAGYGEIGRELARWLGDGGVPGLMLSAVATRRPAEVQADLDTLGLAVPAVGYERLADVCDLAVECTSSSLLHVIAEPMLRAGKDIVITSCGALLAHPSLTCLAEEHGARIFVPTGALLGLDAVGASALATDCSVRIASAKHPRALVGAPFFDTHKIDVESLTQATKLFEGPARECAAGFPANLNVAAALALAGVGPDATEAEVWADPTLDTNQHTITVESSAARISMKINNIPSENPRTGRITVLSIVNLLKKRHAPLVIGS